MVYVLVSGRRARTYVGITTALERRLAQHNGELPGGARSTRSGRPWSLGRVYGPFPDRARAQSVEYMIKRLRGPRRLHHRPATWPHDLDSWPSAWLR